MDLSLQAYEHIDAHDWWTSLTHDPLKHFLSVTFKATASAMLPLRQCYASVPILGPTGTAGAGVHITQLLSCGEWDTHT